MLPEVVLARRAVSILRFMSPSKRTLFEGSSPEVRNRWGRLRGDWLQPNRSRPGAGRARGRTGQGKKRAGSATVERRRPNRTEPPLSPRRGYLGGDYCGAGNGPVADLALVALDVRRLWRTGQLGRPPPQSSTEQGLRRKGTQREK
jgi:hypothetical protein